MVRRIASGGMLLLLALTACSGSKSTTVAVVDPARVAQESKIGKQAFAAVEAASTSVQAQLRQAAEEIQSAEASHARSPQDIQAMKQQWLQMRQQAEEQIDAGRRQAAEKVQRAMEDAVAMLAKEQGWDLVLTKDRAATVWSASAVDQTDLVIRRMDAILGAAALSGAGGER